MENIFSIAQEYKFTKENFSKYLLMELIDNAPSFVEYYISLLLLEYKLEDSVKEKVKKFLTKDEQTRINKLNDTLTKLDTSNKKIANLKISFCIPVKNRSCVNVKWNGITRKRTFVTSYKNKPVDFQLNLLKNLVKSIVESKVKYCDFEVVIADFGSTDHHPSEWIENYSNDNIDYKIIDVEEDFSRGRGLNIAADNTSGDILFFLDADMLISKDLVKQIIKNILFKKKAFFPICFSYYTPLHNEGWLRTEGWGNLAISKELYINNRWWEKKSWGSEDDHMRDQLEKLYTREQGINFFHQWHPEEDFKTKHYIHTKNTFKIVIGVTTFNRIDYLKEFIETWNKTRNNYYSWTLIVSDDGSTDGTIEYLNQLVIPNVTLRIIKHNRVGVHESTNSIIEYCLNSDFDYGFKCDDDVIFSCNGWDDLYIDGMSEKQYLCNYNIGWRPAKVLSETKKCVSYSNAYYTQGAFWTFTKQVLSKVGWFDTKTFGYKGYGHIDYTVRACRAGFNNFDTCYDVKNSNEFIQLQEENYKPAISLERAKKEFKLEVNEELKERFKHLILNERKEIIYLPRTSIYDYQKCDLKPKIHLIIHNNHIGGAEYVHFNHANSLRALGHELIIWSIGNGYFYNKFINQGINIHHVPLLYDEGSSDYLIFFKNIVDGDFIYNCNAYNDDMFIKISREKYIYYSTLLHSDVNWIISHQEKYKYFTYKYIVIHKYIYKALRTRGIAENKIVIVPNTLHTDFKFESNDSMEESFRLKYNIKKNSIIIGFVGRIAKDKNVIDLLDICDKILSLRKDVEILIIGGVSHRKDDLDFESKFLQRLKKCKNIKRIKILGELLGNELENTIDYFDVAINVSPSEGLPISMLEQLGKGNYCIYPSFPAIKDILMKFPSTLINVKQRKDGKDLRYSEEEKKSFIDAILRLDKKELTYQKKIIQKLSLSILSNDKLNQKLSIAFINK